MACRGEVASTILTNACGRCQSSSAFSLRGHRWRVRLCRHGRGRSPDSHRHRCATRRRGAGVGVPQAVALPCAVACCRPTWPRTCSRPPGTRSASTPRS